ncbi:MAG: NAD(P)H-binding protein [Bacteroidota bacterium]
MTDKRTVSILGCGWYGFALAKELIANGFKVKGSTTSREKLIALEEANIKPYLVNFELDTTQYEFDFFDTAVLIICIPPKSKLPALASFTKKIETIAAVAEKAGVKQVIFISSTTVYSDGNATLTEHTVPKPNSASGIALFAVEELLKRNHNFTTTIIRFAGLIGPGRNLAKFFAGRKEIPNGLAPINLIHLNDCIGITLAILHKKAFGYIYHGVTPFHPSRAAFYTQACIDSGLERPEFKNELLQWKQIESVNVPEILGYAVASLLTLR